MVSFFMDKNMNDINANIYESKDKQIVPFLLTQADIKFLGTRLDDSILYFKFSPLERCKTLVNDFIVRKAPLVQAKDLLDAIESYRDMVFEMRMKEKSNHGRF